MDTPSILNIIESTGIIIASITAIVGLNAWRKEVKWKKRNEVAEEILYNLYDVRDRLRIIRHPFAHPSEGETRPVTKLESVDEKTIRNYAYTSVERYNNNREPFLNLEKLTHRYAIYFGHENASAITNILVLKNEIISASYKYAQHSIERNKLIKQNLGESYIQNQINALDAQIEKYASIIWENYENNDAISSAIDETITNQEIVLNKYVK